MLRHVITNKNKLKVTDWCFVNCLFVSGATAPVAKGLLIHEVSKSHTTTHYSRWTPLDELLGLRRNLYVIKHNAHNKQTSMTPVGFEPTISAGERPQIHALDRAATGTGASCITKANLRTYRNEIRRGIDYGYK